MNFELSLYQNVNNFEILQSCVIKQHECDKFGTFFQLELGYSVVLIRVTTEQDIMNNRGTYFKYLFILITLCESKMYNIGDKAVVKCQNVDISTVKQITFYDSKTLLSIKK